MRYKLIGENDYMLSPVSTILNNRGVTNIHEFFNLSGKHVHSWKLLKNIDKAVDLLLKHIEIKNKLFIQTDSDADGFTSAAMLTNYLKRAFPDIQIQNGFHDGKQHGLNHDLVPDDVKLIITPDAGSQQHKEHKQAHERGMDVLVIDHHGVGDETPYAVIVNPLMSPDYPNKDISGAGVTYKFLKALDSRLGLQYADDYLDLFAVGNIADMIDTRSFETRYLIQKGMKQINNPFLKALIEKQSFSMKGEVTIQNIAFYIAPLINATIRFGSQEEKENMFKAFAGEKGELYNQRSKEYEPLPKAMARICSNVRQRQNKARDKGLELIEERIAEKKLNDNKVLIVNVTNLLDSTLTGLVANQLSNNRYKKPVLLIRQHENGKFGGSGRGYEKSELKDFRGFLQELGKFDFVEGHENAFGLLITAENLLEVNDIINEKLKDFTFEDVYEVDFVIPSSQLNENIIKSITDVRDIWGQKLDEPFIAIKDLKINSNEISNGDKKNVLRFTYRGIDFIKFKATEEEYEALTKNENVTLDIVGRCKINEWNGTVKQQIVIEDYAVVAVGKKEYVF